MTIKQLEKEIITAMKEHDKEKKDVLTSVKALAKNMAIEAKTEITDEIIHNALLKERKTIKEMMDTCPNNRLDIMEQYAMRWCVINCYLPKMMTELDIAEDFLNFFKNSDIALTKANKGIIMKTYMPHLKGKADGKTINKVITKYLED